MKDLVIRYRAYNALRWAEMKDKSVDLRDPVLRLSNLNNRVDHDISGIQCTKMPQDERILPLTHLMYTISQDALG